MRFSFILGHVCATGMPVTTQMSDSLRLSYPNVMAQNPVMSQSNLFLFLLFSRLENSQLVPKPVFLQEPCLVRVKLLWTVFRHKQEIWQIQRRSSGLQNSKPSVSTRRCPCVLWARPAFWDHHLMEKCAKKPSTWHVPKQQPLFNVGRKPVSWYLLPYCYICF